jgi:hypothetical protein
MGIAVVHFGGQMDPQQPNSDILEKALLAGPAAEEAQWQFCEQLNLTFRAKVCWKIQATKQVCSFLSLRNQYRSFCDC